MGAYNQLNAPVGEFGHDSEIVSTTATESVSPGDSVDQGFDQQLQSCETQRAALASQMSQILERCRVRPTMDQRRRGRHARHRGERNRIANMLAVGDERPARLHRAGRNPAQGTPGGETADRPVHGRPGRRVTGTRSGATGPQGGVGATGATGQQGLPGQRGATGATGPVGHQARTLKVSCTVRIHGKEDHGHVQGRSGSARDASSALSAPPSRSAAATACTRYGSGSLRRLVLAQRSCAVLSLGAPPVGPIEIQGYKPLVKRFRVR